MQEPINFSQLKTQWNYPTDIHFGVGELDQFHSHIIRLGVRHPLIVTDDSFAQLPVFTRWLSQLQAQQIPHHVFHQVQANPTKSNVDAGIAAFASSGADCVVAMGGGSALDAGKTIALLAKQQLDVFALEDIGDNWKKVNEALLVACIAIPTTAGTGSEVGRAAVILEESTRTKTLTFHPRLLPALVIADPALHL